MFEINTNELMTVDLYDEKKYIKGIIVNKVTTIEKPAKNSIVFIKKMDDEKFKMISKFKKSLIILNPNDYDLKHISVNNDIIIADKPRLTYAKTMQKILESEVNTIYTKYKEGIFVGVDLNLGKNVYIEPNVTIGNNVTILDNTKIHSGVCIRDNVTIGRNCIIRSNTVIGEYGFGVEKDDNGVAIRIPHLGGVIIGDNVDIGTNTSIVAGTIHPTIIEDYVNIDDHVHIAHNCSIGKSCQIVACAEISGSVKIGNDSYIGPNSSVIQKVNIGKNVFVGINSLVNKDITDNITAAGVPAIEISEFKKNRKILNKILKNTKSDKL